DLDRLAGTQVHADLAESGPHPPGEPNRNLAQGAAEVGPVELSMQLAEPVQQRDVAGSGPLGRRAIARPGRVQLDREGEEYLLGAATLDSRCPRIEESHDRGEDAI